MQHAYSKQFLKKAFTGIPWGILLLFIMSSLPAMAQPTPPLQGNWTLTFEDEFDGNKLDGSKWRVGQHFPGIMGEGANVPDQITVADGVLKISVANKTASFSGNNYDYATGEISTFKKFNQKYGYYEARIRYHAVQGMWPAFWLMPDHEDYGWDGKYRESFLKFDLSGLSAGQISGAVLKLTPTSVESGSVAANVLVMKCEDDSWSESGTNAVTWNNKPTPDPLFIAQLYGSSDLSVNTTLSVDVTDYINQELNGDQTASFALMDSFMRNLLVQFASREHGTQAFRPQLVVDGQTLYASEDAFVHLSEPNTTYGTGTALLVADAYGSSDTASTWGTGIEVDIMESLGRWGPDRTAHAMHWDGYGSSHKSAGSGILAYPTLNGDDFHTYGLYWESGKYEFYIDGVKSYEWTNSEVGESKAFMILSLQLGGWDGGAIPALDGRSMEVEYVRAWSGIKTGSATPGGGEGAAPMYTTVQVSEDAFVRSGSYGNNNFSTATNLEVKTSPSTDFSRETFLKFDVSGLDPNSERIELVLEPPSGPSPRDTLIYVRTVADDSWSENTITWNTKPASGSSQNARRFATTDLDFVLDITEAVKAEIAGDGTLSLRLSAVQDDAYSKFYSKESTGTVPYLRATPANSASGGALQFVATDDSYLRRSDSTIHGAETEILVKGIASSDSYERLGIMRFDINSFTDVASSVLLTLHATDVAGDFTFRLLGISESNADESFYESSLHWNNAAITDGSDDGYINSETVNLGEFALLSTDSEVSLTSQALTDFINADIDGQVSFLIQRVTLSNSVSRFASKENALAGPVLEITPGGGGPVGSNTLTIEAETASNQPAFSPFQVISGKIVVPNGVGTVNGSSVTEPDGRATYTFTLSDTSDVSIDLHVDFPSGGDDSFWHKIDSNNWVVQNYAQPTVITLNYSNLSSGTHTFSLARREDGAGFDKLVITTSTGTIIE